MHPNDNHRAVAQRSIRFRVAGLAAVIAIAVVAIACATTDAPTTPLATGPTTDDAAAEPRAGAQLPGPDSAGDEPDAADHTAASSRPASTAVGTTPTVVDPAPTADAGPTPDAAPTAVPPTPTAAPAPSIPTGVEPTRLVIDAIGVDAPVIDLDLRGPEPEVPEDFDDVGWYTQTRLPGELGPAVLAGHIDSRSGPAVFHRLDQLVEGDEIVVAAHDGATRTFVVTGAGQYPKTALPDEVFGVRGDGADLRLITCGGTFDRSDGHYRDNYVVYATAVDA